MSNFYLYSAAIPIVITALCLWFFKPLNLKNVIKGLTFNSIPILIYLLLLYFLEINEFIDSGWSFYTVLFFYIIYLVIIFVANIILKYWK